MPQTTLQHSGCSVVSAVKTIWRPPPSRLPPAKPRTVSAPFRSGCPAPSHSSSLHATLHSIPLHPIPSRLILHLRPIPSRAPFRPSPCSFPQRAAQPAPPRLLPFRHSPGYAHRNYSSKKQKNAPIFLFFHFLALYLSYK